MKLPLQISFQGTPPSPELEALIREHAGKLDRFSGDIMRCHVMFSAPHRHHRRGNLYEVGVVLTVPQGELVVTRSGPADQAHEDARVAVRDAFDAIRRELEDYVRRHRGDVKPHHGPAHGTVIRLFPELGYGFVRTSEGQEVYFHRNAVAEDGFEALTPGQEVRLVIAERESAHGWQATTVVPVGKHHPVDPVP